MSLADVLTRIEQLAPQLQAQQAAVTPAPTSTTDISFADTLAQAQGTTGSALPSGAAPYQAEILNAARENGLDPALLTSLIEQESGFDPNATSAAGAQGLMHLMPATAASLGVTNPFDASQSIAAGARYLRHDLDRVGGDAFAESLARRGLQARRYYRPALHRTTAFAADVELPLTDELARRMVCLPIYVDQTGLETREMAQMVLDELNAVGLPVAA